VNSFSNLSYWSAGAAERMRHRKWLLDNLHSDLAADARKGWSWRGTLGRGCEAIEEPLHPGGTEDFA
jgi:hypothetical protein